MSKIIHKGTFTVYFMDSGKKEINLSLSDAVNIAKKHCGNDNYSKIPNSSIYLYGPGNGSTSIMIREDIEFVKA